MSPSRGQRTGIGQNIRRHSLGRVNAGLINLLKKKPSVRRALACILNLVRFATAGV